MLKGSEDQVVAQWRGTYVHSKVWIFDDRYAIVGSANCDERGCTHDSEAVIGVAEDDIFPETRLGFAHKLRMRLWSKYSLVPLTQFLDWKAGLRVWDLPGRDSMIQRYNANGDLASAISGKVPTTGIDDILTYLTDPSGA